MNNYIEELEPFIEERIQTYYCKLKKSPNYQLKKSDFSKKFNDFSSKLSSSDREIFQTLYNVLLDMNSKENFLAYELGFVDAIKLQEHLKH